jgi:predicted dehydrogenase
MPLKLCLVGAGHMGRLHAGKLAGMKDISLTCIVDVNRPQAQEVARGHGAKGSDRIEDALADGVQGAVIASTTGTHFAVAREFLKRGVHVFVEKPIAADPEEAEALIELAREKCVLLQVGHIERFSPVFRRACRSIRAPLSMEARRTSVFTGRSTDIDVVHDVMIHDIDLALSLNKTAIRRISAEGTPVLTEKADVARARIEFADGCMANLSASRVSKARERSFTIVEEGRYVSLDLAAGRMFSVESDKDGRKRTTEYRAPRPDPLRDELRAFIRAVRENGRAVVDGEEGLRALVTADNISAEIERRLPERRAGTVE